jgi:tetratricopeptide (TPR) repeat protein
MATFQMKEMPASAQVEELLRRGLDFYALNNAAGAARCWEEAAKLSPSDTRASEYLAALRGDSGAAVEAPPVEPERLERRSLTGLRQVVDELGTVSAPRAFDRAQFIELLRDKKYEEALDALYKMRNAAPENASVSRGIQVLKEKLLAEYLARLGNLDLVVAPTGIGNVRLTPEESDVLRLSDGIASLGDVLSSSRLGRFATARAFSALLDRGALAVGAPAPATQPSLASTYPETVDAASPVVPPAPAAPAEVSRYDETFRLATEAYLRRDVDTALTLFAQCLEERPDDRRVQHNIERLQQRKRKS